MRQAFPKVNAVSELTAELRAMLDGLVQARRQQQWNDLVLDTTRAWVPVRGLLLLFPSAAGRVQFEPQSIALVLMRLLGT